jgi:hypothetical protein
MIRAFSLLGLGGGFLAISPALRNTLMQGFTQGMGFLSDYSPYSYIGLVVAIFGLMMLSLCRSSAPR